MEQTKCPGCGKPSELFNDHHIVPRALGGLDEQSNIIRICIDCHAKVHRRKNLGNPVLIKAGLAKARERGAILGHPVKFSSSQIERLNQMYSSGVSVAEIAKELGMSRQTAYRYLAKISRL